VHSDLPSCLYQCPHISGSQWHQHHCMCRLQVRPSAHDPGTQNRASWLRGDCVHEDTAHCTNHRRNGSIANSRPRCYCHQTCFQRGAAMSGSRVLGREASCQVHPTQPSSFSAGECQACEQQANCQPSAAQAGRPTRPPRCPPTQPRSATFCKFVPATVCKFSQLLVFRRRGPDAAAAGRGGGCGGGGCFGGARDGECAN